LGVGFGSYLYLHQRPARLLAHQQPEQIDPVQKGIVLTLAKGQQILLGQKHQGQIAAVNGAKITQLDSLLNYAAAAKTMAGSQAENTLTNHTGKSFSLILADGTEAILDAASSITYPAAFSGNERRVSITGQVYFIVKHNPLQPFKVFFKNEEADDIGTEFNINAYDDEDAVKTTLISGAVRIRLNHSSTGGLLLKPGEQTIANGNDIHVAEANIEEATAWLQGKLVFHHETLENILRQVARIYDVQIVWQDESARKLTFGGSVSRTKKLSTILNYFRNAGQVDFIVEGKTVKVFKRKNN
jgi:transmembrane sensor